MKSGLQDSAVMKATCIKTSKQHTFRKVACSLKACPDPSLTRSQMHVRKKMRPGLQQNQKSRHIIAGRGWKNHFEQSQLESMPQVFLKLGIQSLLTLAIQNAWLPDHSKSWVRTWQLNHQGPVREWRRFGTIQLSETFFRLEDGHNSIWCFTTIKFQVDFPSHHFHLTNSGAFQLHTVAPPLDMAGSDLPRPQWNRPMASFDKLKIFWPGARAAQPKAIIPKCLQQQHFQV